MKKIIFLLVFGLIAGRSFAQEATIFNNKEGAINGYDAVAYFKESKPVKGDKQFSSEWNGATWYFANAENLAAFKTNPEQYAPQYGGYCAYGMSDGEGHKAPTDPTAWTIVDAKLYLNYNPKVKEYWSKDMPSRIKKANENWQSLHKKQ